MNTNERDGRQPLPDWIECQSQFAGGTPTPLTEFIRAYEPVGSTNPDDTEAQEWRQALAGALRLAATQMRNQCVAVLKRWCKCGPRIRCSFCNVRKELESLTLDVEQKQ